MFNKILMANRDDQPQRGGAAKSSASVRSTGRRVSGQQTIRGE